MNYTLQLTEAGDISSASSTTSSSHGGKTPRGTNKKTSEEIRAGAVGYVLDAAAVIEKNEGIEAAFIKVKSVVDVWTSKLPWKIKLYHFGKSYLVRRMKNTFDPKKSDTWETSGIIRRFNYHKNKIYCKSALVVLAVVDSEDFALALEKRAIKEIRINGISPSNETTMPGKSVKKTDPSAFVLYMAFTMKSKSNWTIREARPYIEQVVYDCVDFCSKHC